ncbi:UDP-N-acetylmuramoyl-L-alanine--D-glutamate ligase [Flaviflexus ciconiae]|uniref:UDP-N-acetylmuramoylalanine--D-glutamate ligase n=1 Tax=Flaviflexus ciconiae TaxID=2496867 RepID=A0A3S9PV49_9ACTO|nr:UDP-N-acetylmuramoyl-L-alanine--D-glutamate ligase [Flaviflexus ciconiae]
MVGAPVRHVARNSDFDSVRIAVIGMGVTGRAVSAALAAHTGAEVSEWDGRGDDAGAKLLTPEALLEWRPDIAVVSPGIPAVGDIYEALTAYKIPIWSEIELAWHLRSRDENGEAAPWLAITGTNGKTTTVQMTAAMANEAGFDARAVGNVGDPLITSVTDEEGPNLIALELSSFQLHSTHSMSPLAAGCLNIADDHLDWHGSREAYRAAKARVYENTRVACLYPTADPVVSAMVEDADVIEGARAIGLTMGVPAPGQIGLVEDIVAERAFGPERFHSANELFRVSDLQHLSHGGVPVHLVQDAMMAAGLVRAAGAAPESVQRALASFSLGGHRIETVAVHDGITWIDDSKATNAHAARASIWAQADGSVVWIVGGVLKGARLDSLVADVASKLKGAVVIGTDQQPVVEALKSQAPGVPVTVIPPSSDKVMSDAVEAARRHAGQAAVVMLAPACASWDQFTSYADRGQQFARAVLE